MTLQEIEIQFSMPWPATLVQLFQSNLLGDFHRSAPAALVDFAEDFEPLSVEQIGQELANLYSPTDYRRLDPQYRFLPFAANGAGDLYCLFLNDNPADPPVVLLWHDNDCADYWAKNLADFIFSELLGAGCSIEKGGVAKQALPVYQPYLKTEAIACLNTIYAREPQPFAYTEPGSVQITSITGYLSMLEFQKHIEQINYFNNFGQRFYYALPEPVIVETEENKRRVGTLRVFFQGSVPSELPAKLKQLNWRQEKTTDANGVCYIRKNYVIFGIPSLATLDSTFGPKLKQWAVQYPALKIQFTEDTDRVFTIT
jgi:SMI1 / KNR4 family (SUKH-1)